MTKFKGYSNRCITISGGNIKLGAIPNFSLPPQKTCVGQSPACIDCYAKKAYRAHPSVRKAYEKNYTMSQNIGFVYRMNQYLQKYNPKLFRIHVSGDFYSARYIGQWINIIQSNPNTVFFGFTRSWRRADLLPVLDILRQLPNVKLWASWDAYTGRPPIAWAIAHMGNPPEGFKALQCAAYSHNKRCIECGWCFDPNNSLRSIYFPIH